MTEMPFGCLPHGTRSCHPPTPWPFGCLRARPRTSRAETRTHPPPLVSRPGAWAAWPWTTKRHGPRNSYSRKTRGECSRRQSHRPCDGVGRQVGQEVFRSNSRHMSQVNRGATRGASGRRSDAGSVAETGSAVIGCFARSYTGNAAEAARGDFLEQPRIETSGGGQREHR